MSASPFPYVEISLLAKWRADTYTGSSGSYSLTDLTGNGYTLTQSAGTVTPGTGVNSAAKLACSVAANFQGSQTIPSRYNKTIITIFKRTNTAQIGLFGAAGASPFNKVWQGFDGTNIRHLYVGNASGFTAIAQAADSADANQVRAYTDFSMRHALVSLRDNLLLPSMNFTSNDGDGGAFAPALGTSYRGMVGDWYETRVYDGIMSPTQLDIVAAEINSRYALSLPLWSSLTERKMILIGGQSNAAGPVAMASLPSGYAGAQTGVDIWTGTAYGSTISTLNSTSNNNQGAGASKQNTYGFEMSVGKDYIGRVGGSVTLYKYAAGSTALSTLTASNWAPATLASLTRGFLHQYWLTRYAMQQLGQSPTLLAMCWFQGEQDATDLTSANAYETNLTAFISSLNGQLSSPILWLVCRLANEGTTGTYLSTVRAAQEAVATALVPVDLVDTDSYQMADAVHLGATGQINLGTYLAGLLWDGHDVPTVVSSVVSSQSYRANGTDIVKHTFVWVSDSSENATVISCLAVSGTILQVVFVPSTTASPTANYDVTLTDEDGIDVFGGQGANLSATVESSVCPSIPLKDGTTTSTISTVVDGILTLNVSNAGVLKAGKVIVYVR